LIKNNIRLKQLVKDQKSLILNEEHRFEIRFTKLLSDIFSPTQIELILLSKIKVYKWLPSDIASAISLSSISPTVQEHILFYMKQKIPFSRLHLFILITII